MAKKASGPLHRGKIEAQGGGTQKAESWAQDSPPTMSEVLKKCDLLEAQLSRQEKFVRQEAFAQLRAYIGDAAKAGEINAHSRPHKKSFPQQALDDIRVDLNIFRGCACVPDPPQPESAN